MVFYDLSSEDTASDSVQLNRNSINIAGVSDRILACLFDLLIFSPFIGLLLSFLVKEITLSKILETDESLSSSLGFVYFVILLFSTSFLMGVFLFIWQATPGQKFMQLGVISYPSAKVNRQISLNQSLVRSFFWCFSWLLLGLPFLEIFSHPLRRTLHERVSDTMVITQKKIKFFGPLPIESHFINSILRSFFIGFMVILAMSTFSLYDHAQESLYTMKSKNELRNSCDSYVENVSSQRQKLDILLTLSYTNRIDEKCAHAEISRIFSSNNSSLFPLAYLGRAILIDDDKLSDKYLDLACESSSASEICHISKLLKGEIDESDLSIKDENSLILGKVVLLDSFLNKKNYFEALSLVKSLESVKDIDDFLMKKYVSIVWSLKKNMDSNHKRLPASLDTKALFKEFESKFGIL